MQKVFWGQSKKNIFKENKIQRTKASNIQIYELFQAFYSDNGFESAEILLTTLQNNSTIPL